MPEPIDTREEVEEFGKPEAVALPPARYAIKQKGMAVAPLDCWPAGSAQMALDGGWCWWPEVQRLLADRDRLARLVQRDRADTHALMGVLETRTRQRDEWRARALAAESALAEARAESERLREEIDQLTDALWSATRADAGEIAIAAEPTPTALDAHMAALTPDQRERQLFDLSQHMEASDDEG